MRVVDAGEGELGGCEGVGDDGDVFVVGGVFVVEGGGVEVGGSDVVCVRVAVDQVGDGEVGDVADCVEEVVACGWGGVDDDDALAADEEHGLVISVRDHICALSKCFDAIAGDVGDGGSSGIAGDGGID